MSILLTEPPTPYDQLSKRMDEIAKNGVRLPTVNRIPVATVREGFDCPELFAANLFTLDGAVVMQFTSYERDFSMLIIVETNGEVRTSIVGLPAWPGKHWQDAVTIILRALQEADDLQGARAIPAAALANGARSMAEAA